MKYAMTLMVAAALVSCGEKKQPKPQSVAPTMKELVLVPLPGQDNSFATEELVEAYQASMRDAITGHAQIPDPDVLRARYASHFKVTTASVRAYLEELSPIAEINTATPTFDRRKAEHLEREGDEYEAGLIFAGLKDAEAVKRCIDALKQESEWNAIAVLAAKIRDDKALTNALKRLKDQDAVSRIRLVIRGMILDRDIEGATDLAKEYGFDLDETFGDELMAQGEKATVARIVRARTARFLASFEEEYEDCGVPGGMMYELSDSRRKSGATDIFKDILRLAKLDRKAALALAEELLKQQRLNVAFYIENGEATSAAPVNETVAFYEFIKHKEDLKQRYLRQVGLWLINGMAQEFDAVADEGVDGEWLSCALDDVFSYGAFRFFAQVAALGDKELLNAWQTVARRLGELSRWGESPEQQFVFHLLGLQGNTEIIDPFRFGEISDAQLKELWKELALPMPTKEQKGRYKTDAEIKKAAAVVEALREQGKVEAAEVIERDLEASGYVPSAEGEGLSAEGCFTQLEAGNAKPARAFVVRTIVLRLERAHKEWGDNRLEILWALQKPAELLRKNKALEQATLRDQPKLVQVYPANAEEVDDILRPLMADLYKSAPKLYVHFLRGGSHSGLYDEEVKRLAAVGDLDTLDRLTAR